MSSTQCHQHTLHTDIRRAYAAVFTSVREGLNTYPLEAVFARRNVEPGVVVLSEFASCSRVLNGAIRVNPWRAATRGGRRSHEG